MIADLPLEQNPYLKDLSGLNFNDMLSKLNSGFDLSQQRVKDVRYFPSNPTINQYIVANPVPFLQHTEVAKRYGFDIDKIYQESNYTVDWRIVAKYLPVIYIVDSHQQYGTLGFQLNIEQKMKVKHLYPTYRAIRDQPLYLGGHQQAGSTLFMIHQKPNFPENREWKTLPGHPEMKLYFSPNVAMANELCMTKDALPGDFKFFHHATIWLPNQLDQEYEELSLWLTMQGPLSLFFLDDSFSASQGKVGVPLWCQFFNALSPGVLERFSEESEEIEDENDSVNEEQSGTALSSEEDEVEIEDDEREIEDVMMSRKKQSLNAEEEARLNSVKQTLERITKIKEDDLEDIRPTADDTVKDEDDEIDPDEWAEFVRGDNNDKKSTKSSNANDGVADKTPPSILQQFFSRFKI